MEAIREPWEPHGAIILLVYEGLSFHWQHLNSFPRVGKWASLLFFHLSIYWCVDIQAVLVMMMMTPHKWPLCQALRRPQTLEVLNIIINCIAWLIVATPIHQCPSAAASQLDQLQEYNKNQHCWRKVEENCNIKRESSSRIRSPYPSFSCERYNICYIWRWQADKLNIRISRICQPCPVSPSPCIAQWIIRGEAQLQYLNKFSLLWGEAQLCLLYVCL